jgi:tetratricopeptide (TPR) repeat protein
MKKYLFTFAILLYFVCGFNLYLSAFYDLQRYSFPAFCEDCFHNSISSKNTWIEPCDSSFIHSLKEHLHLIPKPYINDCRPCSGCGGVSYCLHNRFWLPTDIQLIDEISYSHLMVINDELADCEIKHTYHEDQNDKRKTNFLKCWDGSYFRLWNHKYSHYFKHFLFYCSENPSCRCFWPEKSLRAVNINDKVYSFVKDLCEEQLIDTSFSPYWESQHIKFSKEGKYFGNYYYPNSHGMASSLTTYTFFYSQYHQLLISLASYIDANSFQDNSENIDNIYELLEELQNDFLKLYTFCLRKHPHPKIYYERGMINLHSGDYEEALNDIYELAKFTESVIPNFEITSDTYQQEGRAYNEFGIYDKAVVALTKALKLDPENKEAYFERSYAYFELGNFEEALTDYTYSENSKKIKGVIQKNTNEFCLSLLCGVSQGGLQAAVDFLPNLCNLAEGITETLWTTAQHPIEATNNFCNICFDVANDAVEYFKDFDWDKAEDYSEELKGFCCSFNNLSDSEKGQKFGYLVGKNGTDILLGGKCLKAINNLRKLKYANAVCNLEAMLVSKANKNTVIIEAQKHIKKREEFFKNVKIVIDSQNKHIVGNHNYLEGRSILEHKNPQGLLDNFCGTGVRVGKECPGVPGFKEIVDFKEHIGIWKNFEGTLSLPTTKGTIHYSKKGAHIVPAKPTN